MLRSPKSVIWQTLGLVGAGSLCKRLVAML